MMKKQLFCSNLSFLTCICILLKHTECYYVLTLYIAGYLVTRPAVALVINEDNYKTGVVQYVSNGSVVFLGGESHSTTWPGK